MPLAIVLVLLALHAPLGAPVAARGPGAPAARDLPAEQGGNGTKDEKADTPLPIPKLSAIEAEKAKRLLNFIKTSNPEKRLGFEDDLIAVGRGALPLLLERKETTHEFQILGIERCLAALIDVRDAEILADLGRSKNPRLRRVAVLEYSQPARPQDQEILARFLKDADPGIRLEASLGLVRLGNPAGIGEIAAAAAAAKSDAERERLFADLPRLKGKVYSSHFRPLAVKHEDPEVRRAALAVLAAIGDRGVRDVLGQALDDDHNLVKAAAVNGLRKLLRNEEPITFATVFELVDAVETWKKELGLVR